MTAGADGGWRPRVVVCGTGFGRTYLAALRRPGMPFQLVGILARGSARSQDCARHYDVPLYTDPDHLPSTVDIAAVVLNSGLNGGRGAQVAQRLLARGVHVLQEHPLHHTELAGCLRLARRHAVVYHLNTHYVHADQVASFIQAARALVARQAPVFVDALTSFQVLHTLIDLLGQALGGLHPWSFSCGPATGAEVLRTVDGTLAGVAATLRVQNQIHATERDNGAHIMHRVTLGTEGGNLMLANTHGPVLWNPRLHMPAQDTEALSVDDCLADHLDLPSAVSAEALPAPTHRSVIRDEWPRATGRALLGLRRAIIEGEDGLAAGQFQLAVSRLVADIAEQLGRPQLITVGEPAIMEATALVTAQWAELAPDAVGADADQVRA